LLIFTILVKISSRFEVMDNNNKQTNNLKIVFGLATPIDAREMVSFRNDYYHTNRKPEQWLWEYCTNIPDKSVLAYARDSNKVIGTLNWIPVYIDIGGRNVLSGKGEDYLLSPSHRTGIMVRLWKYSQENCRKNGMEFLWGFTNGRKAFEKLGFTRFPVFVTMVRGSNLLIEVTIRLKMKNSYWIRLGSAGKAIINNILTKAHRNPLIKEQNDYTIIKEPINENRLKGLYSRLRNKYKDIIFINIDEQYLQWRVRKHPFLVYDEFQVLKNNELRAYAIVNLNNGIVSISDLTSEEIHATDLLINAILKHYAKTAGYFQFLGNKRDILAQSVLNQLEEFGFRTHYSKTLEVILRDLTNGNCKEIYEIQNLHINGLWTEGYVY
jgi:hypothetical protein